MAEHRSGGLACRDDPNKTEPGNAEAHQRPARPEPEIYLGVEIELTGRATNETTFKTEKARIRKIRVKSAKWDDLLPARKAQLLNDTFYVLKERYPNILETIVLEFDDDRPRLSLKYSTAG